jgi:hypothetical protein
MVSITNKIEITLFLRISKKFESDKIEPQSEIEDTIISETKRLRITIETKFLADFSMFFMIFL